jgi:hypothetical protein
MEIWKIYPGNTKYEVSTYGNVRNAKTKRLRKFRYDHKGYLRFNATEGTLMVHRLVLETFITPIAGKTFCNHLDAKRDNNHVDNLEWCDQQQNMDHAYKIGTRGPGEMHGRAKLTEKQAIDIKYNLIPSGVSNAQIARDFGISPSSVASIKSGANWKHI